MHKVYGVSKSKIELLPFGADDIRLAHEDKAHIRYELRSHFGVGQEDILLVTGGKIDRKKNIDALLEAFREFKSAGRGNKIHLLVFGKVDAEMESLINFSDEDRFIHYAGWVDSKDTFRYFWAADMAIFPGTHSVLWEEAIGLGTAVVLRRWYGMEHLDLGGNCLWLEDGRKDTIKVMLEQIDSAHDVEIYSRSTFAETNGPKRFSYSAIAAQALSHAS